MSSVGISEIVLIVDDVRPSARFYEEVVGLTPETHATDAWAWFWAGEPGQPRRIALHRGRLGFEEHSPHPEGQRWGHVHFALHVPREDLAAAGDRVRARGVEVFGPLRLDWMNAIALYFYDPDGNLVEFSYDQGVYEKVREVWGKNAAQ